MATRKSKPWRVVPLTASGPLESSDHSSEARAYQRALELRSDRQTGESRVVRVDIHAWHATEQRWELWEEDALTGSNPQPSRFHATPAEIDAFLRQHFAEDTLLRYQQAIGGRAVSEAAKDVRMDTNLRQLEELPQLAEYGRELADLIDLLKGGGHYPSSLISFGPQPCPTCDGTGGDHQIGCQP